MLIACMQQTIVMQCNTKPSGIINLYAKENGENIVP